MQQSVRTRMARIAVVTVLALVGLVVTPGLAEAAYTPATACAAQTGWPASGFTQLNSSGGANPQVLTYFDSNLGATITLAHVYLLWNASHGANCAVTLKDTFYGTANTTSATLEVQNVGSFTDSSSFQFFAAAFHAAVRHRVRFKGGTTDRRGAFHTTAFSNFAWCS